MNSFFKKWRIYFDQLRKTVIEVLILILFIFNLSYHLKQINLNWFTVSLIVNTYVKIYFFSVNYYKYYSKFSKIIILAFRIFLFQLTFYAYFVKYIFCMFPKKYKKPNKCTVEFWTQSTYLIYLLGNFSRLKGNSIRRD